LIPICALSFGTTALGVEREEHTLVFLLTRPIPRWQILLAKILVTLPLCCGLVLGSFALFCQIAGPIGLLALKVYWPAMLGMTAAYLALFHLFAVVFRHPTMLALVYALFMELFVGNLPGSIKRLAINYYGRSLLYALGATEGLKTPRGFELLPAAQANWTLAGITAGCLVVAFIFFQKKEFRDVN
jgi:ABC-2 type transport system permease protein